MNLEKEILSLPTDNLLGLAWRISTELKRRKEIWDVKLQLKVQSQDARESSTTLILDLIGATND